MKLLKKNKSKYNVTGYLNYESKISNLNVNTNGTIFSIIISETEVRLTKEEAKEVERLLSHALGVFDTSYYNFD